MVKSAVSVTEGKTEKPRIKDGPKEAGDDDLGRLYFGIAREV